MTVIAATDSDVSAPAVDQHEGYRSRYAYAAQLIEQGRQLRHEIASEMHADGLSYAAIARALGISSSYARDLIHDPDASSRRERVARSSQRAAARAIV